MKPILFVTLAGALLTGCAGTQQQSPQYRTSAVSLATLDRGVRLDSVSPLDFGQAPAHAAPDARFRQDYARALSGDPEAMIRLARMYGEGTNGVTRDQRLMVQWLRKASDLSHAGASYELYLHYLGRGLDREAVRYENLAVRQGYVLPPRLDPRRG